MRPRKPSVHKLPVTGVLRLNSPAEIWYKPALSVVVASAVPNLLLYSLGRLDLVMYTMAGSLCALYGHNLPYARRVHTVLRVVLGMAAGFAVALVTASLTDSTPVLIAVGALLAAVQKTFCDATRIGPPGNVIFTFITSAALFAPQEIGQVPGHMALMLASGAFSWLVSTGPALWRREGPERLATARALDAAAAYATAPDARTRHAVATAVQAAWQSLLAAGRPTPVRQELERLVVHAEWTLATVTTDGHAPGVGPDELRRWAAGDALPRPVPGPPSHPAPSSSSSGSMPSGPGSACAEAARPGAGCCAPSAQVPPCCRSPSARSSGAHWPAMCPPRSGWATRTGPSSRRRPSTSPTSPSPGAGPCSGPWATFSGCWSSPRSSRSPGSARWRSSCASCSSTSPPRP